MKTLQEIFNPYSKRRRMAQGCDKGSLHSYLGVYEELFSKYRDKDVVLLEMGVFSGHSLLIWDEYFNSLNKRIIGADLTLERITPEVHKRKNIELITQNIETINDKFLEGTMFDIAIDDASHKIEHQIMFIDAFINRISDGGFVVIEDVKPYNVDKIIEKYPMFELYDLRKDRPKRPDNILLIYKK